MVSENEVLRDQDDLSLNAPHNDDDVNVMDVVPPPAPTFMGENGFVAGDFAITPTDPDPEIEEVSDEDEVLVVNEHGEVFAVSSNSFEEPGSAAEEVEECATVRFDPPIYIQRYCKVRDTLQDLLDLPKYKDCNVSTGKTVMEVGCAEFGMMRYLKHILDIGKLIFLDLDKALMEEKSYLLRPLPVEYLQKPSRPEALVAEAYAGCVTKVDPKINVENPDIFAIIAIELIEHLYPQTLRGFEETVFGIYSPQIVIVTTPNSEFNEVFNLHNHQFRHWDHKFEWTRHEFDNWCKKIIDEFQEYTYRTEGVGKGPEDTRHLGCVSQMAVFEKKNVSCGQGQPRVVPTKFSFRVVDNAYTLIQSVEFPNYVETRSLEQIVLDEFNYVLNTYILSPNMISEYISEGVKTLPVPLNRFQRIYNMPDEVKQDISILRNLLEAEGYQIETEGDELRIVFDIETYAAKYQTEAEVNESDVYEQETDLNPQQPNEISSPAEEEDWE